MEIEDTQVSERDWLAMQHRNLVRLKAAAVVATFVLPALAVLAMASIESAVTGAWRFPASAAGIVVLFTPVAIFLFRMITKDQDRGNRIVGTLTRQLSQAVDVAEQQANRREVQADRQEFETRLANALDMAEGEPEVIDVIERSFATVLPSAPVELLLADNSHAHLRGMASSAAGSPGCTVDSPDHCPAARRAQVQRFAHSDDLDACPKLRGRSEGAVAAVCVPVSIMGRTVGVIHSTAPADTQFADDTVLDLGTLSKLAGTRIGLLRVMAETQLQAATDSLTGLLNRRSFETRVAHARRESPVVSVAMADLDHFKTLNDTYGHETGDRALRLFAQVLAGSVRGQDLVCRQGGEEFVVALMGCEGETARTILDAVRGRLEAAITVAGLPTFTVSFGLVEARHEEALPALIDRADTALFQAKSDGRDRVVRHDRFGGTVGAISGLGVENSDGREGRDGDVNRVVFGSGRTSA
ncbi:MAG: diguanylate cyclase [Nakamurella sp.]